MEFVKSAPGDDPIVVEGYFAADPANVFRAWTDPDIVVQWFGQMPNSLHSATIDLRPGGAWRFLISSDDEKSVGFEGQYQDVLPDRKLVFSWVHVTVYANGEREETPSSRVEVTFTPKGSGTTVRLVHSAIQSPDALRAVGSGWQASFTSLASALEKHQGGAGTGD